MNSRVTTTSELTPQSPLPSRRQKFGIAAPFVATAVAHCVGVIVLVFFVEESKRHVDEEGTPNYEIEEAQKDSGSCAILEVDQISGRWIFFNSKMMPFKFLGGLSDLSEVQRMKHFCALVRKYGIDMYRLGFVGRRKRRRRVEMVLLDHGKVHSMRRFCRELSIRPLRDTCMSPAPILSQDDWPLLRKAAELGGTMPCKRGLPH